MTRNRSAPLPKTSPSSRNRQYYVWTVGCQMNISDSARLESALQHIGYRRAAHPEDAGFLVINSCSVRASAEQRVMGKLGELQQIKRKYPDTRIVLWGCMVGPGNDSPFRAQLPMVDYFVSPSALDELVSLAPLAATGCTTIEAATRFRPLPIRDSNNPPVCGYIPIQYGCNMSCSYCVIPMRRGREQSRTLEEIVEEAQRLVALGTKELILLGQIVDSWGHDLPGRPDLSKLLAAVHDTPGLLRLRFLTSHPAWMSQQIIETVASLPHCQHEINLPIQAGHNAVLKLMRRGYTLERYRELVQTIRATMPDSAITTDIIVGHPGETRQHFEQTLAFVEEMRFDKIHIAAFSARPGTLAAEMEQDAALAVLPEEKQTRRHLLETLQERIATEINASLLGKTVEVLVEGQDRGKWRGRSSSNKLVFFEHPGSWTGQLVLVQISHTSPWSLQGSLVSLSRSDEKKTKEKEYELGQTR